MNLNFYRIVIARFLFVLAVQIQSVVMGWQIYSMTKDPLALGLLGLSTALPAIGLGLFAGLLVDRFNPLRLYQSVIFISLMSVLVAFNASTPTGLYVAGVLTGLMRSFTGPAMNSLIPRLVSRSEIKRSSAYTTIAFQSAMVIGPGMAGVLLGIRGFSLPYLLSIVFLVIASFTLLTIDYKHPKVVARVAQLSPRFLDELLLGVKFVMSKPLLLSAMSLDMFAVLFGGVVAMLPIYAVEVLDVGAHGLGWLRGAPAVGAILMGAYLVKNPISKRAGLKLFLAVFGFGLCILVFGISKSYWISFAALVVSGALDSVSMVVRAAIVQLSSPENMRGRIAAVNAIFIGSSNEIGEFESGVAAKLLGTVPSVIFGGCMTLLTVGTVFLMAPSLRRLDLAHLEKEGENA